MSRSVVDLKQQAALASGEADFAANIYNNASPLLNNGLEVVVFMETLLLFDVIVDADYAAAGGITADMDWEEAMQKLDCTNVGVVARNVTAEDLARILINVTDLMKVASPTWRLVYNHFQLLNPTTLIGPYH